MSQLNDRVPQLGYVEPVEHESISHYLGRLRQFKANSLPSAYALGQAAGIGGIISRWEKLYFNPFPTGEELGSIASLIGLDLSRFQEMLPSREITFQPRPIRLCGACYEEVPCHRMKWQYKRPPAKVFVRSFSSNKIQQYSAITKDWLNMLTSIDSID